MTYSRSERGATAVVVAISMLVIMGFAALVIDLGAGFNERAQDQSAADASVMAGAIEVLGNAEAMRDKALEYARSNLDTTYTDAEWASTWESCSDPEKASLGLGLTPVPGPAADGNWTGVSQLDCISTGSGGFLRVRIPDQIVATTFGKTMGADQLEASAAAVARRAHAGRVASCHSDSSQRLRRANSPASGRIRVGRRTPRAMAGTLATSALLSRSS